MSETNKFLIHKHETAHPHYDFYLQLKDRPMSWIIPNGIPSKKKEKKVAIHKDPPNCSIDDLELEKKIEDSYGEGKITVWDIGSFKIETNKSIKIIIEAKGAKLCGKYLLHIPNWGRWTKKRLWTLEKIS